MLQWPGEVLFASILGIVILLAAFLIQQPDPPHPPVRQPSPERIQPASPLFTSMSTAYSEGEIAGLITELYELFVSLAYLDRDQITWPPPSVGHRINEDLCISLGLAPSVISLMKNIPYVNGPEADEDYDGHSLHGFHIFPRSEAYSFLRDQDIIESRDPENLAPLPGEESELRLDYLLPHDVALSHNLRDGMTLVLDTTDNTVRMLDSADSPEYVNPEGTVLERPEEPMHYRNYFTQDAPSYFRKLVDDIRSLKLIPSGESNFERQYHGDEDPEVRNGVREILVEKYGWPDDFRQEDWARDAEGVWNKAISESIP